MLTAAVGMEGYMVGKWTVLLRLSSIQESSSVRAFVQGGVSGPNPCDQESTVNEKNSLGKGILFTL